MSCLDTSCECICHNEELNTTPTLIILKNSIKEGAVPTPQDLEIGEVALSLFPGQEALWVKNSNGEVVDVRKPNSSGLWDSAFETYTNRTEFDKALEEGKIEETKLYFIQTEKQIWVKGEFYGTDYDPSDLDKIVDQRIVILPAAVYSLNPESDNSEKIASAFGGSDKFKELALNVASGKLIAGLSVGTGSVPVNIGVNTTGADSIVMSLSWMWAGVYKAFDIVFNYNVFAIKNDISLPMSEMAETLKSLSSRVDTIEDDMCWIEAN